MLFIKILHFSVYSRLHIGQGEISWINGHKNTYLPPREALTQGKHHSKFSRPHFKPSKNCFAREDRGIWGIAALICFFVGCKFLRDVMFLSYRSVLRRAGYTYLRRHPRSRHSERMIPSPTGGLCSLPLPVAPATSSGRASLALRSATSCSLSAALEFTKAPYPTDSHQVKFTPQNHTKPRTTVCTIFHSMLMVKSRVQT